MECLIPTTDNFTVLSELSAYNTEQFYLNQVRTSNRLSYPSLPQKASSGTPNHSEVCSVPTTCKVEKISFSKQRQVLLDKRRKHKKAARRWERKTAMLDVHLKMYICIHLCMYSHTQQTCCTYFQSFTPVLPDKRQAGINGTINTRCTATLLSCSALPKFVCLTTTRSCCSDFFLSTSVPYN